MWFKLKIQTHAFSAFFLKAKPWRPNVLIELMRKREVEVFYGFSVHILILGEEKGTKKAVAQCCKLKPIPTNCRLPYSRFTTLPSN